MRLYENGIYLVNGTEIIEDNGDAAAKLASKGITTSREDAAKGTMAYGILDAHNTSGNMEKLQIKFDKMTSHDTRHHLRRDHPDSQSLRPREISDSIRSYQLPQQPLRGRRYDK